MIFLTISFLRGRIWTLYTTKYSVCGIRLFIVIWWIMMPDFSNLFRLFAVLGMS